MAYRRKTYRKKRIYRKKKMIYKRKSFRRSSKYDTTRYTGNVNVECNSTLKMEQSAALGGVKLAVPWGVSSSGLTGYNAN